MKNRDKVETEYSLQTGKSIIILLPRLFLNAETTPNVLMFPKRHCNHYPNLQTTVMSGITGELPNP